MSGIKQVKFLFVFHILMITATYATQIAQKDGLYAGGEFHGFLIKGSASLSKKMTENVTRLLPSTLGNISWKLVLVDGEDHLYELQYDLSSRELRKKLKNLPFGKSWDMAYAMEKSKLVKQCEPIFTPVFHPSTGHERNTRKNDGIPGADGLGKNSCSWPIEQRSRYKLKGKQFCFPKSSDAFDWADKKFLHFSQARELLGVRGEGVLVAHPDTGYWSHDEIIDNILPQYSYNFVDNNTDAVDSLKGIFYGHGVMTSSLIISPSGRQNYQPYSPEHISIYGSQLKSAPYADGVAPGAQLISYKVLEGSVVLVKYSRIIRAIKHAISDGVGVISVSLGGLYPSSRFHSIIKKANKKGIIIVAAAGNYFNEINMQSFVVWPARYPAVVAVGASDSNGKFWQHSSKGKEIDISAPGAGVWGAHLSRSSDDDDKQVYNIVRRVAGTSPATGYVAGAAALFLSHHGHDRLKKMYGRDKIGALFQYMLKHHAYNRPSDWDADHYGPGILDVYKLLSSPLPELKVLAASDKMKKRSSATSDLTTLFPEFNKDWLKQGDKNLSLVERELIFYLSLYTLTTPAPLELKPLRAFFKKHPPSQRFQAIWSL